MPAWLRVRTSQEQTVPSTRADEGRGSAMDFSTGSEVPSDDVSTTASSSEGGPCAALRRQDRRQPRRAADRVRQGHAAATATCSRAKATRTCSPASPRPMPTTPSTRSASTTISRKLWFMPATPVLSNGGTGRGLPISCYLNSVVRQPRRHRRHLERECLAGVPTAAASAPIGAASAASASRSASTARPAASSRSSA